MKYRRGNTQFSFQCHAISIHLFYRLLANIQIFLGGKTFAQQAEHTQSASILLRLAQRSSEESEPSDELTRNRQQISMVNVERLTRSCTASLV